MREHRENPPEELHEEAIARGEETIDRLQERNRRFCKTLKCLLKSIAEDPWLSLSQLSRFRARELCRSTSKR